MWSIQFSLDGHIPLWTYDAYRPVSYHAIQLVVIGNADVVLAIITQATQSNRPLDSGLQRGESALLFNGNPYPLPHSSFSADLLQRTATGWRITGERAGDL